MKLSESSCSKPLFFWPPLLLSLGVILFSSCSRQIYEALQPRLIPMGSGFVLLTVVALCYSLFTYGITRLAPFILGASVAIVVAFFLDIPEERFHLLEYGLVGAFWYRFYCNRFSGMLFSILCAVMLVSVTALGDELFQWVLPWRVGDLRDVLFDIVGGTLGIMCVIDYRGNERMKTFFQKTQQFFLELMQPDEGDEVSQDSDSPADLIESLVEQEFGSEKGESFPVTQENQYLSNEPRELSIEELVIENERLRTYIVELEKEREDYKKRASRLGAALFESAMDL